MMPLSCSLSLLLTRALHVLLFATVLCLGTGSVRAQPSSECNEGPSEVRPYTVGRILVDNDALFDDEIRLFINQDPQNSMPTVAVDVVGGETDDEMIIDLKAAVDSIMSGGVPRFRTTVVGETTLLVNSDRDAANGEINTFAVEGGEDGGFNVTGGTVRMPALVIDFDPVNPMGGFDQDSTEASGGAGSSAIIEGNQDSVTTAFSFPFTSLSGDDSTLVTRYMRQIQGDPEEYCMDGEFSGFMVLRQGDAPVVQGGMTIVDDTMGGAGLVLPVISGVTPSFVDAADTGMTMTLRGYNLLEPSDEPVAMRDKPRLFINRVEIDPNDITAVNPFTLQFPIPSHPEGTIADLDFVAPWGSRTELGRITYRSGLAFSCRSGSVNANALNEDPNSPYSLSLDVLFINGQSGDANNEMTLTLEDFIQISVRRPPSIPLVQPVAYTLYAHFGPPPFGPTELTAVTQPNMRGCSCFPLLMGQGAPQPRKVLSGMIPATREEKMLLLSPIRLCTKLGQLGPQNIFFQLVIQDQYSNDMSMDPRSVSNGILLRVTNPNPNPCQ